ncbi:MAG: hypothetical protein NVSMB26_07900 [Beijerinckiaceae bacterium]
MFPYISHQAEARYWATEVSNAAAIELLIEEILAANSAALSSRLRAYHELKIGPAAQKKYAVRGVIC